MKDPSIIMNEIQSLNMINLISDRFVINLLGEICWGFHLDDFESKIGAKKEIVEALLEKLIKEEKQGIVEIELDDSEVRIIRNAFDEVKKEIEDWEFSTRIGVSLERVSEIAILK